MPALGLAGSNQQANQTVFQPFANYNMPTAGTW
jgi:hypothetical protein